MTGQTKKPDMKKLLIPIGAVIALIAVILTIVLVVTGKESYRLIKINSFEGGIELQREEKGNVEVFKGLQLISADTVAVGEDSFLELLADSDKHIAAEENTGFKLYSSGDEKNGNISIDLLYGKALFTIDNKLNEGSFFQVTSPNATLSVRGTTFSTEYDAEEEKTVAEVMEGTVVVTCDAGAKTLEKGDKVAVIGSGDNVRIEEITDSEYLLTLAKTYPQVEKYTEGKAEHFITVSEYTATAAGIMDMAYSDSEKQGSPLLNPQSVLKGYLDSHAEEVNKYFEENKETAVKSGKAEDKDVTEWITDKLTVGGATFNVEKAYLNISVKGKSSDAHYFTSETHKVRENGRDMYYYADGVTLAVYGSAEEKPAVTTTTTAATTTTTTATEEKPKEKGMMLIVAERSYQKGSQDQSYDLNGKPNVFNINVTINQSHDNPSDLLHYYYSTHVKAGEQGDACLKECFDLLYNTAEAHLSEINAFFEENYIKAVAEGREPSEEYEDVTDWYPEEFIIDTSSGKFRLNISCVDMLIYGSEVHFKFYGSDEKIGEPTVTSPVVTEAPEVITKVTTAAPVTTTKKTTTTAAPQSSEKEIFNVHLGYQFSRFNDEPDEIHLYDIGYAVYYPPDTYETALDDRYFSIYNKKEKFLSGYYDEFMNLFTTKLIKFYLTNEDIALSYFNEYKKNNFAKAFKVKEDCATGAMVEVNLDTDMSDWVPDSLVYESEEGDTIKIYVDDVKVEMEFLLSDYDASDTEEQYVAKDPETGKNYYVRSVQFFINYYGTSEKIN